MQKGYNCKEYFIGDVDFKKKKNQKLEGIQDVTSPNLILQKNQPGPTEADWLIQNAW